MLIKRKNWIIKFLIFITHIQFQYLNNIFKNIQYMNIKISYFVCIYKYTVVFNESYEIQIV